MSKSPSLTDECAQSRTFSSTLLTDSRESLVTKHKLVRDRIWNVWLKRFFEEDRFDYKHFDNLIENEYMRLRGLYGIPFTFDSFSDFVYSHQSVWRWRKTRGSVFPWHRKRGWLRKWDSRIGPYYRVGTKFVQHGVFKKTVEHGDQYEVDTKEARRDWRDEKRFEKRRCPYRRGCPKWMKAQINREDRRAASQALRSDEWDNLFRTPDPKDRWRWD